MVPTTSRWWPGNLPFCPRPIIQPFLKAELTWSYVVSVLMTISSFPCHVSHYNIANRNRGLHGCARQSQTAFDFFGWLHFILLLWSPEYEHFSMESYLTEWSCSLKSVSCILFLCIKSHIFLCSSMDILSYKYYLIFSNLLHIFLNVFIFFFFFS